MFNVWCFAYIIRDSHWLWSEFVQSVTSPGACHCSNCIWVNQSIITSDKGCRGSGGVSPAYGSRWESVYLLIRFLCVPLSLITQSAISDFPLPEYISVSRSIREHTLAKATALRWALQIIILQRDILLHRGMFEFCVCEDLSLPDGSRNPAPLLCVSVSLYNCAASPSLARRQAW